MTDTTPEEFDRIRAIGRKLDAIVERDNPTFYRAIQGASDYLVRMVEEAQKQVKPPRRNKYTVMVFNHDMTPLKLEAWLNKFCLEEGVEFVDMEGGYYVFKSTD